MFFDPYTLFIFPGSCGLAQGELYLDDEHTLAHETGMFALRKFDFTGTHIRSSISRTEFHPVGAIEPLNSNPSFFAPNTVERIVIANQLSAPVKVVIRSIDANVEPIELKFSFDKNAHTLTIKKPDVRVADDWVITLEY
jgi:alpha 1,3-glucosidase